MSSSPKTKMKDERISSMPLRQIATVVLFGAILISFRCFFYFSFVYVLLLFFTSEFGRRSWKSAPRDLTGLVLFLKIKWKMRKALEWNKPIHEYFLENMRAHPDKECCVEVESGRSLTFSQFNAHSNKYAHFFKTKGYKKGDVVSLFLENGIEFVALWLGLSKLGIVTAWINSNLKMESLAHSIQVSNCSSIITSRNLLPTLLKALEGSSIKLNSIPIFLVDGNKENKDHEALNIAMEKESSEEPARTEGLDFQSVLCYIYTSGTTGHPKAAIIKHYRFHMMSTAAKCAFDIRNNDRIYITMPIYHSAGGIIGIGQVVVNGLTAVIRTKFSASNFWKDCIRFDCTVSQYIGEICRYLLAQKESPEDRQHNVRVMYGNGMRPEIWGEFVRRFGIKRIGELYGSTEGNSNILNLDNHEGSCGFMPIYPWLTSLYPIKLIRVDEETGEIFRDSNGLCVICCPGETGEMVGMIRENDTLLRFEGYVNKEESTKKVIKNVASLGDSAFSSGDILYWDKLGYLYFKDRRGDTYRWHGENVSTTQVEGVLQPIMAIVDASAYGVAIPGKEGRAGMISVALADGTETEKFIEQASHRLNENLASYAIPLFLRICKEVDRTGTYKLKKAALQKESYDLKKTSDPIFYWDSSAKSYKRLTDQMQHDINHGIYNRI